MTQYRQLLTSIMGTQFKQKRQNRFFSIFIAMSIVFLSMFSLGSLLTAASPALATTSCSEPCIITVGYAADPDTLPEPGGIVAYTVTITNNDNVEAVTLMSLIDDMHGNVTALDGDCAVNTPIAAGAAYSCIFQADVTGGPGQYTSTIEATVQDSQETYSNSASATVTLTDVLPAITVQKDNDANDDGLYSNAEQLRVGNSSVTFRVTITNEKDEAVTIDAIEDNVHGANSALTSSTAPSCASRVGTTLSGNQIVVCYFDGVISPGTAVEINKVTVTVSDNEDNDAYAEDTSTVTVPGLTIEQSPTNQQAVYNTSATITFTITNTGGVTLTGVAVSNSELNECNQPVGSLAAGAIHTYPCTTDALTTDVTNLATVNATDSLGDPISDSDTATIAIINPDITISKTPPTQVVRTGNTATFTVTVTNSGEVPLSNVALTNPQDSSCQHTHGSLAPTATFTHTCSRAHVTQGFSSTTTVTGQHVLGQISAGATASVSLITPTITVTMTPANQTILKGGNASFTVTVSNGDSTLHSVNITNSQVPNCNNNFSTLAANDSETYTCNITGVNSKIENSITASGIDLTGEPVTDTAQAIVNVAEITISKSPASQTIRRDGTASFTILVTNSGSVPLSNIRLVNSTDESCEDTRDNLAPQTSFTHTCTRPNVLEPFTTATVVTADYASGQVSAGASASVAIIDPAIAIDVTPATQTIMSGTTAAFTVVVTNTGDVPLSSVAVSSANVPDCNRNRSSLAVDETWTFTCNSGALTANTNNNVAATGIDTIGEPVNSSDLAAVTVINPVIGVNISPPSQQVRVGSTATFTITVKNNGNTPLSNVALNSAQVPSCQSSWPTLNAGASQDLVCLRSDVPANFDNQVIASGQHLLGGTVSDDATALVTVINPSIVVTLTPDIQSVATGATANFSVTVHNSGDVGLTQVAVESSPVHECNKPDLGPLTAGASTSYTCSRANVTEEFLNNITAKGRDPLGIEVSASDSAFVSVDNPHISIVKSPDEQTVRKGETASFTIVVVNTGSLPLTGVRVRDPLAPDCNRDIALPILPQASANYSCVLTNVTTAFTNIATVTGTHGTNTVSQSDTAFVHVLDLAAGLSAAPASLPEPGGPVAFTAAVTNHSSKPVTLTSLTSTPFGNLANPTNSALQGTTCTTGNTLQAGGSYTCVFTATLSGQPGNRPVSITAQAADNTPLTINATANTTVIISNVPSSIAVGLAAVPTSIPAPGGPVTFTVRITNTSPADSVSLNSLMMSEIGNLHNRGTCAVPQTLAVGGVYQCTFTATVSGAAGQNKTYTVTAVGVDDDGQTASNSNQRTIAITQRPLTFIYLPSVGNQAMVGEPNNECAQAYPIGINQDLFFLANDKHDWYQFDLPRSGYLVVELSNFMPAQGQITVWSGACGALSFLGNNGNNSTTKNVDLGTRPAGRYYIWIINDGPTNLTQPYKLRVRLQ